MEEDAAEKRSNAPVTPTGPSILLEEEKALLQRMAGKTCDDFFKMCGKPPKTDSSENPPSPEEVLCLLKEMGIDSLLFDFERPKEDKGVCYVFRVRGAAAVEVEGHPHFPKFLFYVI